MKIWSEGRTVWISVDRREETHTFETIEEAATRAKFIEELLGWNGTPFVDCGCVRGQAVDCAKLIWRCAMDSEMVSNIPEPIYPSRVVYKREETFLAYLTSLGATEIETPRVGDIHVYFWGFGFKHGAVRINSRQIIHAYAAAGMTKISHIDEPLLNTFQRHFIPRPVKYFNVWKR